MMRFISKIDNYHKEMDTVEMQTQNQHDHKQQQFFKSDNKSADTFGLL